MTATSLEGVEKERSGRVFFVEPPEPEGPYRRQDDGEGFVELDFAVAELAGVEEAVEVEVGEEEEGNSADEEEAGADPFELVGAFWEEGVDEE